MDLFNLTIESVRELARLGFCLEYKAQTSFQALVLTNPDPSHRFSWEEIRWGYVILNTEKEGKSEKVIDSNRPTLCNLAFRSAKMFIIGMSSKTIPKDGPWS